MSHYNCLNCTAKEECAALELNVTDMAAEGANLTNVTDADDTNVTSVNISNNTKQDGSKSMLPMHACVIHAFCIFNVHTTASLNILPTSLHAC